MLHWFVYGLNLKIKCMQSVYYNKYKQITVQSSWECQLHHYRRSRITDHRLRQRRHRDESSTLMRHIAIHRFVDSYVRQFHPRMHRWLHLRLYQNSNIGICICIFFLKYICIGILNRIHMYFIKNFLLFMKKIISIFTKYFPFLFIFFICCALFHSFMSNLSEYFSLIKFIDRIENSSASFVIRHWRTCKFCSDDKSVGVCNKYICISKNQIHMYWYWKKNMYLLYWYLCIKKNWYTYVFRTQV